MIKPWHIIVLIVVLLIVFGSAKLPDIARSLGQSAKVMKKELRDLQEDDDPKQIPPSQAGQQNYNQPGQQPYQNNQFGQQGGQYNQGNQPPGQPYGQQQGGQFPPQGSPQGLQGNPQQAHGMDQQLNQQGEQPGNGHNFQADGHPQNQ
ncbi:MAG: Sec-independent protein translocase subunit TatA [Trueperella sp.]|nr:Sec-independent protein translocase subunit TatA [Trueperella sp.]